VGLAGCPRRRSSADPAPLSGGCPRRRHTSACPVESVPMLRSAGGSLPRHAIPTFDSFDEGCAENHSETLLFRPATAAGSLPTAAATPAAPAARRGQDTPDAVLITVCLDVSDSSSILRYRQEELRREGRAALPGEVVHPLVRTRQGGTAGSFVRAEHSSRPHCRGHREPDRADPAGTQNTVPPGSRRSPKPSTGSSSVWPPCTGCWCGAT
jgi:hypothetical protein